MKKKLIFNWEYCECGCHCHECSIAGECYSLFNDLKGGYHLNRELTFKSWDAVEKHILNELRDKKKQLMDQRNEINRVLRALKSV